MKFYAYLKCLKLFFLVFARNHKHLLLITTHLRFSFDDKIVLQQNFQQFSRAYNLMFRKIRTDLAAMEKKYQL